MNNETPSKGAVCTAQELWPHGLATYCFDTEERNLAAKTGDWHHKARIIDSHTNAIADELAAALAITGSMYERATGAPAPSQAQRALARYQQLKAREQA